MLKKLLITLFAVFYLGISSGATLHFQYCMGKLMRVTLAHEQPPKCNSCGMDRVIKETKTCCVDKHQQLLAEKSLSATYNQVFLSMVAAFTVQQSMDCLAYHCQSLAVNHPVSHAPPFHAVVPVFLRNCTFRI